MREWFEGLESRERMTLLGGGIFLGLVLLWVLLINPLYVSAGARSDQLESARQSVLRARQLSAEIDMLQSQGNRPVASNETMLITLERTARESGLQVNQSRPIDASTVRVRFESASFDKLVQWMGVLEQRYSIQIEIASLDRLDIPGLVDAQLTLKRPG
ncbi:MAG: type II secretion system protein M [Gammaproteobacteria bacterium]|nr:type II secretion system protein M [Gammaproteobacteria bacterium]